MFKILFQIVLIMSAIGSIFWIAISILQPITERFFSCRWQYNMRLISIIFLILPVGILGGKILSEYKLPEIQPSFNISNDFKNQHSNSKYSHPDDIDFYEYDIEDYSSDIVHSNTLDDIISSLPYIWIVGIFVFGIYKIAMLIEFKRRLKSTSLYIDNPNILDIFKQCQFDIWVKNVSLMYNEMIDTPMTVGIFKPKLLIPEIELTDEELKIIFLHELVHCRRKDLYFKLIAMIANTIHWFNPIVYFIVKDMEQFCEISCDEEVVKDMNEQKRHFYGETILNVLSQAVSKSNSVHVTLCENKKGIERRLTFMLKSKNVSKKFTVISTALALILSLSGFTASSIVHSTTLNEIYKNYNIEQLQFQNLNSDSNSKSYSSKNYLKSIERGEISELYLNASEANVTILKSNDSKFNFEYDQNMDVSIYTENPYKLKLDIKTKDYSNLSFKMYIPEIEFDKFSIESSDGFISIPNIEGNLDISIYDDSKLTFKDNLLNSNMDLYSDSSSVYIKSDTIDSSFNIELEDSSATLNSQNINSKLSISSDSSSVYVSSDSINSEIDIDSDSDSVTVISDNLNSDLNIDADSSSLKLKVKYINSNFEIKNDSGDLNLNTDTINSNVNLRCDDSNVVIKLNKNPSNLKLNISDCEYAILPDGWSENYSVGNGINELNIKDANDVRIYVDGVKSDKIIENNLYYNNSYDYISGNDINWDGVRNLDGASKEEWKSANKVSHINSMDGQYISQILVDIDKCGLIVKKSDNNEFSFDFVGFNDESAVDFKTEVVDNKLIVNAVRNKTGNIIISTADDNVVNCISMKIPEKLYERFDVTGNGAVRLPNIQGNIYVFETSGSVVVSDTEITSNIYVEGSSGSVKVETDYLDSPLYVSSSGSLKLDIKNINAAVNLKSSGSTSVSVENINSDMNIDSSGSMKLEFSKQPLDLKLDATRCRSISLPDGWSKNYIVGNGSSEVTIQSSGSAKIIIK